MSLDFSLLEVRETEVFEVNITHNLTKMATEAGLYYPLWHPEDINIELARDLAPLLRAGLFVLEKYPEKFKEFDAPNGWGRYENFVPFVRECLEACVQHPDAKVSTWV